MSDFKPLSKNEFKDHVFKGKFKRPVNKIVLHMMWKRKGNKFWGENSLRGLESYYKKSGRRRAFHFAVNEEGIWPFAPIDQEPEQTGEGDINEGTIAIEIDGVINHRFPTWKAWDKYFFAVRLIMKKFDIPIGNVFLHSDFHDTTCPGFKEDWFKGYL